MGSLAQCFAKAKPKAKFIPYLSLGDPTMELSVEWSKSIADAGADILELGIPFSDPVADGPVIQASYKRALAAGFSMAKVLEITGKIHKNSPEIPLVYLSYFNPINTYGLERFFQESYQAGIRGMVLPDIPFDSKDSQKVFTLAERYKIDIINLITPSTPLSRMRKMKKVASGFIYYVTSFGVTGVRTAFADNLSERVQIVKDTLQIPVCAGFGISRPEQAREISQYADGIIIGSAVQKIIEKYAENPDECNRQLGRYIKEIRASIA
ncbi:MAG: tryptophan synthase subunit alpha [Spirochaetota bacterium]